MWFKFKTFSNYKDVGFFCNTNTMKILKAIWNSYKTQRAESQLHTLAHTKPDERGKVIKDNLECNKMVK